MSQTRRPEFYASGDITDTFEGRFDLLVMHVALVLYRLKAEGETGKVLGQKLFDLFFADMDAALRELGVGDTSVGKRIREMSEAFYGRLEAYDSGLAAGDDEALCSAVSRNLYGCEGPGEAPHAGAMASYMRASARHMQQIPVDGLASRDLFVDPPQFSAAAPEVAERVS